MPEDYTDVTKNPYYDPNLGSGMAAPRERRPRPLKMAPKGKFTAIANQIRAEERMEQLRKEIEESGQANIKEEDLQLKDGFQKVINLSENQAQRFLFLVLLTNMHDSRSFDISHK